MTRTKAVQIITQAFSALPKRDRLNLRYHAEQKTEILCGKKARIYQTLDNG